MIPDGIDINTSSNINWMMISTLLLPIDNMIPISWMRSLSHRTKTKDKTTSPHTMIEQDRVRIM